MPKTKDELITLKQEIKSLKDKLSELSEEELVAVVGGDDITYKIEKDDDIKNIHIYTNDVEDNFLKK